MARGSNRVGGHPPQPRRKVHPAPLESRQIRERLLEHLRRHILGLRAAAHAARHVHVRTIEVAFVKLREAARIALGCFNQKTLFLAGRIGLQRLLRKLPSIYLTAERPKKSRVSFLLRLHNNH